MKRTLFLIAVLAFSLSATATFATYHGQVTKEGSSAVFIVGFASDKKADIKLKAQEHSGIDISYSKSFQFDPEKMNRSITRKDSELPLKEFGIRVENNNSSKQSHQIPVTVTVRPQSSINLTNAPQIIQEREYIFRFIPENTGNYNFEGELIAGKEPLESEDSVQQPSKKNDTKIIEKQSDNESEITDKTEEDSTVTYLLIFAVIGVFTYLIYEVTT